MGEAEKKILSTTEKAHVGIYPKHSLGFSIAKFVAGQVLGVFPRFFTMKALDSYSRSDFLKTIKDSSQVTPGEIKDILEKWVKLKELTLTNKNFLFLYEKGVFSKQQKLIAFPLEHAKTVESHKNKSLTVSYEVPEEGKDKTKRFELRLEVQSADDWANKIQSLLSA